MSLPFAADHHHELELVVVAPVGKAERDPFGRPDQRRIGLQEQPRLADLLRQMRIGHRAVGRHLGDVGAIVGRRRDQLRRIGDRAQQPHGGDRIGLERLRVGDARHDLGEARDHRIAAPGRRAAEDPLDDRCHVVDRVVADDAVFPVIEPAQAHEGILAMLRHRRACPSDLDEGRSAYLSEMVGTRPAMTRHWMPVSRCAAQALRCAIPAATAAGSAPTTTGTARP